MEMRLQAMREETQSRTRESILTRVVGAHLAARCKEHRPESDPRAELHNASLIWECVEPEHRAIEFALPRCTTKWPAIVRRTIQVPRLKFVRILRWRQESKSRWHATLANLRCASSYGCGRRWRERNPNRWLRTFGASAQALF